MLHEYLESAMEEEDIYLHLLKWLEVEMGGIDCEQPFFKICFDEWKSSGLLLQGCKCKCKYFNGKYSISKKR